VTLPEYEKGLLAQACWRLARNSDVNELVAIGCVIRNWVITRVRSIDARRTSWPGTSGGTVYFPGYAAAIAAFLDRYPLRPLPDVTEPALVDPAEGLLAQVDGVYSCSLPDLTSSRAFPGGARYFARVTGAPAWFEAEILVRQDEHPLIGSFGSQQFYG